MEDSIRTIRLYGGFVHESINSGTFKRFYKTRAKIYALEVTKAQYDAMEFTIRQIEREKENYQFNVLGLFAAGIHKKIGKEHSFYCAEFVKYVLEKAGVHTSLPEVIKPEDFKKIDQLEEIYEGYLRKYSSPKRNITQLLRNNLLIYREKEGMI